MSGEVVSPTSVMAEYACNLEKKQRNLLKRKARLESYKETLRNGGYLTCDQEKAVAEYDSVCQQVDALKETADVITEMQVKVDLVVKENEIRMSALREKYTIDAFRKICPFLELLLKLQLPAVKAAVTKVSSPNHLKALENASKILIFRPPIGFKIDEIDSSNVFKRSAEFLFKLASGAQASANGRTGKARSVTFAELRQICLDLLSDEVVRSALASPLGDIRKDKLEPERSNLPEGGQSAKSQSESVCNVGTSAVPENSSSSTAACLPAEAILNSVIDPLKSNFNFLQASQIASLHIPGEQSAPHSFSQPVRTLSSMPQDQSGAVSQAFTTLMHHADESDRKRIVEPVSCSQKSLNEDILLSKVAGTTPRPESAIGEKSKSKQKSNRVVNGVAHHLESAHTQPTPLQDVIDAELAQQQTVKSNAGGVKSWADCVRGTQGPPISESVKLSTPQQSQQPSIGQNGIRDHQPLRGKPAHLREPRDHRPARQSFNEGETNSGRSGPKTGFRGGGGGGGGGRGRGNGSTPFRGGRGRGARGSFYPRGGFDAQSRRQASVEAAS